MIELQRYGVEVVALDKYANAPAMQVAHRSYVVSMLDGKALREIIEKEKPDYIVPEVEAIATTTLLELEKEGYHVIPTAKATWLTMNREGIRRLAAEELGLPTSPYRFAATEEEFNEATFAFVKYYVQGKHYDELVEENKKLKFELEQEIEWRNRTDS